jgi:uncharacterized repeat protein (TIGR01451 family)
MLAVVATVCVVSDASKAACGPSDEVTAECPDLNISKLADTSPIHAGDLASYSIVVWNAGPGTAVDVSWSDDLPAGVNWGFQLENADGDDTCISGIDSEGHQAVSCSFGNLAPSTEADGKRIVISGMTDREDCAALDNTAYASATNGYTVEASASIEVLCVSEDAPTLVIDKTADTDIVHFVLDEEGALKSVDPAQVAWTLTYTLANGPVDNVVITDLLPQFLVFVSASDGGMHDATTQAITWNLGTITASGSVTVVTTVDPDAPETEPLLNVATIDSDETAPDRAEDSIWVTSESEQAGRSTASPPVPDTALAHSTDRRPALIPTELLVLIIAGSLGLAALAHVRAGRHERQTDETMGSRDAGP